MIRPLRRPLGMAVAAALPLAGCTVGPQHPATTLSMSPPVAPATIAPAAGGAQQIVADARVDPEWWHQFGSPVLDSLVARALAANTDIAVADATLAQAREQGRVARGAQLPQVDASYQAERARISQALSSPLADINRTTYTLHTAQLSVTYPLDLFGLQRNRTRSALAQVDVAADRLVAARTTVVANLVVAVVTHAALIAQIEAAQTSIRSNSNLLDLLRRRQQIGDVGAADVAAQQTALAAAEGVLPPLQRQLEHQRALIATLTGAAPGTPLPQLPLLGELVLPPVLPVSLPAAIVANRPDVRAAEAAMRGAGADVGAAIAARLPQIPLTAQAGGIAESFGRMFADGNPFWQVIGQVTQPIFHGGQLLHQQHAAEAALEGAKAQYRAAVLQAFTDVSDALAGVRADAAALDAADRADRAARQSLDYTRRQIALGGMGTLQLLNASAASAQAAQTLVQARAARLTDTVALFQAVGGGVRGDAAR